jgi:replicative DNA helicase
LVPPHDIEAEQSVLGAILISGRVMQRLAIEVGLREDGFYRETHSDIYAAMCALFHTGEPVDELTVIDQLRRSGKLEGSGGDLGVDALAGTVPNVANVHRYATIVRDLAVTRRLLMATYEIQGEIQARRHDGRTSSSTPSGSCSRSGRSA